MGGVVGGSRVLAGEIKIELAEADGGENVKYLTLKGSQDNNCEQGKWK